MFSIAWKQLCTNNRTKQKLLAGTSGYSADSLSPGNYLHFQPNTAAQCNVIPVWLYRKATNDPNLKQVKPTYAYDSS